MVTSCESIWRSVHGTGRWFKIWHYSEWPAQQLCKPLEGVSFCMLSLIQTHLCCLVKSWFAFTTLLLSTSLFYYANWGSHISFIVVLVWAWSHFWLNMYLMYMFFVLFLLSSHISFWDLFQLSTKVWESGCSL